VTTTWDEWVSALCCAWLIVAGVALPHVNGDGRIEDTLGGVCIAVFLVWAFYAFRPRAAVLAGISVLLAALQVASAPWVLGYAGPTFSSWNDGVAGLVIAACAAHLVWRQAKRLDRRPASA
jgi:hypothetical protein